GSAVLGIAYRLEPLHRAAFAALLDGEVGHGGGGCGAVPMLFACWNPNHVAGMDLFHRSAGALGPAAASNDDKGLTKGVGVPVGTGAGLKGHASALCARRVG